MAANVSDELINFETNLSLDDPATDYEKLMDDTMRGDVVLPNEIYRACWKKISTAARETVWKMLFDDQIPQQNEQLQKAAELLKLHKEDACFYGGEEYNKWIVLVRDELLKREMVDFWKNEIVEKELGPCWARDSDLFDDTEDREPENFYKYAGCEAHWLNNKTPSPVEETAEEFVAAALLHTEPTTSEKALKKLSIETPLEDYKFNMEAQQEISEEDAGAYLQIFKEARDMIWHLLFGETTLNAENSKKAGDLLEELKTDACFYAPYEYNIWISKVKDELIKRKYTDFWQDVIVKKELGLCWAGDSDYFDDMEDPRPLEFYKVNEELNKQQDK